MSKEITIFVEDDSTYNYLIDSMFFDAFQFFNMKKIVEYDKKKLWLELLKRRKVQRYSRGKLNFLLSKQYELYSCLETVVPEYENVYVVFLNSSFLLSQYPANVLKKYQKKWPNIKYILLYIDIVSHPCSRHANILRESGIFDLVYTVDADDAKKYGLLLWPTPYSKDVKFANVNELYDLYFCGVTKDRINQIESVLHLCRVNSIHVNMDIIRTQYDDEKILYDYHKMATVYLPDEYMPYPKVLQRTLQAKCILEIVQSNQTALTLRPYEAICYNRKLLTNNKTILDFPFYNPQFMQYYEKPEDIDWEWVRKDVEVNYNYKNEYSPINLIEDIHRTIAAISEF